MQQHMVYTCLSMPTEKLFISYGASDAEGASLRPSGVVARVSRIFGNMAPKSALTEKKIESVSMAAAAFSHLVDAMASGPLCGVDQMVYGWFKNSDAWREKLLVLERLRRRENRAVPLRKEQMELLFPKDIKTSVSRLEQYNACPFSYFMNYMLKAAPRQKSGVALPDSGTYLHRMMDGFCRVLAGDGLDLAPGDGRIYRPYHRDFGAGALWRYEPLPFGKLAPHGVFVFQAERHFPKRYSVRARPY